PLMAGVLLAASGAAAVFALAALVNGLSAILVATVRTERVVLAGSPRPEATAGGESTDASPKEPDPDDAEIGLIDGLRLLRRHVGSPASRVPIRGGAPLSRG